MPRDFRARENTMIARERRQRALDRTELRYASESRITASGATSFAVKKIDDETAAAIEAFLAKKESGQ